jgi:hypothetical protein
MDSKTSWIIGIFGVVTFLMTLTIFVLAGYSIYTGKPIAPPIRIEVEHK